MGNIVGVQGSAHGGDEAVADPQPKTAAPAGSFGREERIEEVRQGCRWETAAGVGDHHRHLLRVCAGAHRDLNVSRPVGLLAPALDDRVARVGEKIEDDLLQVERLTMSPALAGCAIELDGNALRDVLPTRHLDCGPDAADDLEILCRAPVAPGEDTHMIDDRAHAYGLFGDQRESLFERRGMAGFERRLAQPGRCLVDPQADDVERLTSAREPFPR